MLRANLPWLNRMLAVDAAESRGDAAGALRLMEDMALGPDGRPWWRPERLRRLRQLADLGDGVPAWVWGRWIVAQAAQSTPGQPRRANEVAVTTRGGPGTLWGVDHEDARAKVMDHDWVYRQLVLYEYGGLTTFVRRMSGGPLVGRVSEVTSWSSARMGAYELLAEEPDRIRWLDLASRDVVETVNLGGASLMAVGEAAIGRIVEAAGTKLFESAPLCVPPEVAHAVADAPQAWMDAVAVGCRGEWGDVLSEFIAKMNHFDLLSDLSASVRRQLLQPADPGLRPDRVGTGGNGREYDAALVLAALAGEVAVEAQTDDSSAAQLDEERPQTPLVAAALLEPGTIQALVPMLVASDAQDLRVWAGLMPAPADRVCMRLADRIASAA